MRIEHIRIDGFGRLIDFDTGGDPLGSLVVFLGPNEAGKSTLFSFLTTALYGFQPASRELSPHVPWGSDEAGGEIRVRLAQGGCAVISRSLRSTPAGTLTVADATHELRNRPVRWVEHVPRTVFRQVFAITLAELAGLDEETWATIQDKVLGSMGASDLASARDVADALEREAGEIWRPNRRGNQRLRDLQGEIRALRSRRNHALQRDHEIRALVEEREHVAVHLQDAREDRHRDKLVVERVQELLPLKRQLERIETLRRAGGPRSDLVELPQQLVEHREMLESKRERLNGELQAIGEDLVEPEAAIARLDDDRRALLSHRDTVSAFVTRAANAVEDHVRAADLRAKRQELDLQLRTAADHLLGEPPSDPVVESVMSISTELLHDRIARFDASSRRRDATGAARGASGGLVRPASAAALVAAGSALLAWGLSGGPVAATAVGAACLSVGVVLGVLWRPGSAIGPGPRRESHDAPADLRDEIERMLSEIPVRPDYLDPPGTPVAAGLERLQKVVREAREARHAEQVTEGRITALNEEAARVSALLDRSPSSDSAELANALERELHEASSAREAAEAARRERARILRARDTARSELADVEDQIAVIEGRIWQLAAGAAGGRPIDVLQKRLDAHARADRLEEELETAHPDLASRIERIRSADEEGVAWTLDEDDLARHKLRVEKLDETIEELIGRGEALERDIAHLRDEETVDTVDGEIESLREEEARLTRERDRKWLLAKLVREADRAFREEHQPDLLRRASDYLGRLTGGRYDRLLVDEERGSDLFQLMGPELPAPVALARPISTGTLEQAYLSLRLAIVDHLDQSEERLPLFMDEAFVNWDRDRRERGLEALAEVSRTRQVFAFTCHPEMAEDLGGRGACVLRLQR